MKKFFSRCLLFLSLCTSTTFAANCGIYLGAGAGHGTLRTPSSNVFVIPGSVKAGGLSGRVFAGYNLAPFFGIEGGLARYARSRYEATDEGQTSSIRYYVRTADLVGKVYVPLPPSHANIYVLAGVVSYWETIKFADADIPTQTFYAAPNVGTTHQRRGRPIYGGGISYDFTPHLTANAEYTQIQNLGNFRTNPLAVPNTVLITGNLAFNFG